MPDCGNAPSQLFGKGINTSKVMAYRTASPNGLRKLPLKTNAATINKFFTPAMFFCIMSHISALHPSQKHILYFLSYLIHSSPNHALFPIKANPIPDNILIALLHQLFPVFLFRNLPEGFFAPSFHILEFLHSL